jgi:hypothetical protein
MAQKGAKRVHMIAAEHAENITVVGCVNAIGNCISPMIIFKGNRLKPEFNDNLLPGSLMRMAPKGPMTRELFVDFIRHLARYKTEGRVLLIFDGASSHLDYTIVEAADEHMITLFCLPSNTTHELQPLDKAVYRSLESNWDTQLLRYWDIHPERHLNKFRFNIVLSKVWPVCMTPGNITNGFEVTKIYPFDPNAIPEDAFAASLQSHLPQPQVEPLQINVEGTLNRSTSDSDDNSDLNVPLATVRNQIIHQENEVDPDNTLHQSFQELLPTHLNKVPDKKKKTRRKALNYKAQNVTTNLFNQEEPTCSRSQSKPRESWCCSVCQRDEQKDMRICVRCLTYYHEECVGLTVDDTDG